jgi:hypothetical protein
MKKNNIRKGLLFAIKCCLCNNEFVYCINSGNDFRCYECKKKKSLKDVEKELKEMPLEEYNEILKEIEEYEKENGKIEIEED